MAYTIIDDPSKHFQAALYTGNGGTLAVTNDGNSDLQPDLVWTKRRNSGSHNTLVDSSRGATKQIYTNLTHQEETVSGVTAFNSDGFTLGSNGTANANNGTFIGRQWKVNGGTTSTNTTGNGIDAVIQANAAAGFSIVTYTGNGTQSGQTVGHGLGAVPKMIISKDKTNSSNVVSWRVYHEAIGNTKYLELQSTAAISTFNDWDNTSPTSSVYSVGGDGGYTPTNTNNALYMAYVFADVQGYSKFGSYTGTGTVGDGPFVYTGFKPAFVMLKTTAIALDWFMFDAKRAAANTTDSRFNEIKSVLYANDTAAGSGTSYRGIDFFSNGFKLRNGGNGGPNQSAQKYIYMAFAEQPFVTSTGVPATSR